MNARDRIASHLRRILVAAGMALPQPGHADTSAPKPPGKPDEGGKKKPGNKKPKERERLGYEVVDMMPEPYVEPQNFGTLVVVSHSQVTLIDGKPAGKSPYKLPVGTHVVTFSDGKLRDDVIVEIRKNQATVERHELTPSPAPKATK